MSVLELVCHVDDVCRTCEPTWHQHGRVSTTTRRNRVRALARSAMMTILILFHQRHSRTCNAFSTEHTRHRSPINFLVNLVCGLIADRHQPKKPSLPLKALPLPIIA